MRTPRLAWLLTLCVGLGLVLAVPAWAGDHGGGKGKGKSGQKDKDDEDQAKGQDQDKGNETKGGGDKEGNGKGGEKHKGGGEAGEGEGAGKEHGKGGPHDADFRPPGWDKGKKKGWEDEYPPGWDKKTDEEKGKWKKDVEDAKEEVGLHADARGVNAEEKARWQEAVERIARKGKEVKEATASTVEGLKKGKKASDILAENGITVEVGR
jgi:hypothetical protein